MLRVTTLLGLAIYIRLGVSQQPACGQTCTTQSFSSCNLDVACICQRLLSSGIRSEFEECINKSCSPDDQEATRSFADSICATVSVTLSLEDVAVTASGSFQSTDLSTSTRTTSSTQVTPAESPTISAPSDILPISSSSPSLPSTTSTSENSLTTTAKVGIGIGVGLGVPLVIALLVLAFYLGRIKQMVRDKSVQKAAYSGEENGMSRWNNYHWSGSGISELDGSGTRRQIAELGVGRGWSRRGKDVVRGGTT
ncbi:hypothetical protein EJ05DRAFT_508256 [Pseudovirgaria hyperparasitica]|uniref:CFEM domain-containing protein n=1 Tax=Pseudovirgaria hyperparasitica TaxID=470096 RepID=A0A6A6WE02_9PEZI|nr:uncharacterized protein EJ05DRAFT_508256 [Pseudovirgaria hyperparasitica]KAF2761038.1 hypothetical protein EJ05DRAFT_508256 [Pseudovirgaria hyperparasitica]